jgi:hypothetical protein
VLDPNVHSVSDMQHMATSHLLFTKLTIRIQICWILTGLIVLFVSLSPVISGDGITRYAGLIALANGEIPTIKFSLVQALLSLPLYALGKWFGNIEGVVSYFNFLVFSVTICAAWLLLPSRNRFHFIVFMMCASMFPNHVKEYYGETLSVCLILIGFLLLERDRFLIGGIVLGIGTAQIPATIPAYFAALLYYSYKTKNLRLVGLIAIPVAIALIENWFKFGSLFSSPYLRQDDKGLQTIMPFSGKLGFSYPFYLGLISILFSFGKGLLFFIPSIFLVRTASNRKCENDNDQRIINTFLIFVAMLVFIYAKWWSWYGGGTWGPRFFLIASVASSFIFAKHFTSSSNWKLRLVFSFILVYSGWVCIQGYLYGLNHLGTCNDNNYALEMLCWYVPEFSPIFAQLIIGKAALVEASSSRFVFALWCCISILYVLMTATKKFPIHAHENRHDT